MDLEYVSDRAARCRGRCGFQRGCQAYPDEHLGNGVAADERGDEIATRRHLGDVGHGAGRQPRHSGFQQYSRKYFATAYYAVCVVIFGGKHQDVTGRRSPRCVVPDGRRQERCAQRRLGHSRLPLSGSYAGFLHWRGNQLSTRIVRRGNRSRRGAAIQLNETPRPGRREIHSPSHPPGPGRPLRTHPRWPRAHRSPVAPPAVTDRCVARGSHRHGASVHRIPSPR